MADRTEDEMQEHPVFQVARAAAESAELAVGLQDMQDRVQFVIGIRVLPDEDAEVQPEGGVFSLTSLSKKEHLNLLMEVTQRFAKQIDYPLEMMVIGRDEEPEG